MADRVLFLPGAGGSRFFWEPLSALLPQSREHVIFGWPGFDGLPRREYPLFTGTRKPFELWLIAAWMITGHKYGANAVNVKRMLGVKSYKTAWPWLHKFRRAMIRPGRDKLSGLVEVDETYVGGEEEGEKGRYTERNELSRAEVTNQLRALGVKKGGVLLVHTSFRATRPVEGGPLGLIEALRDALGPDGTLVMPSWSGDDDQPFDPMTTPASLSLGVVADKFWRLPGVLRSNHCHAFAAAGPEAARITSDPLPLPPHVPESPVGRVHDLDGQVLLLGLGHDADTTLHLAELLAGVPYRVPKYCTVLQDGRPVRIDYWENDHCCVRFAFADEWLRARGRQSEGRVGHAHARLARARDIVGVALEHLAHDPLLFLHPPSAGCVECNEARRSTVA